MCVIFLVPLSSNLFLSTGIPTTSLFHIARSIVTGGAPLNILADFVKAVWFQAVNVLNVPTTRGDVLEIIGYLNEVTLDTLGMMNESDTISDDMLTSAQSFVKYSAALICYAYSCPLSTISDLGIVTYIGDHVGRIS